MLTTSPATLTNGSSNDVYLFSSFRDNGEDGLHLAWSEDGLVWTPLKGDQSFLRPQVGSEKLMRDPCVVQGPDGTFHMVWTDSWGDRTIGYSSSEDLIHWTAQMALPVMRHEPAARNCWAPEIVYNEVERHFLIIWATSIPGRFPETDDTAESNYNHRIYATTTPDFETFTPSRVFYDGGFNVIDASILRSNHRFYLFVKDESLLPVAKKHLLIASSDHIEGPFRDLSEPFTPHWVEGPTALQIGGDTLLYFDEYTRHRYGAMRSRDLKTWEDISGQISFPPGTRHGSAFKVARSIVENLRKIPADGPIAR